MATLAVDVGGTKIAAARVTDRLVIEGDVLEVATPATHGAAAVVTAVVDLLGRLDHRGVGAVGIAAAGVVDPKKGLVVSATSSIRGWAGTPLASEISSATGLRTSALNDGHAFAIGEAMCGAGRGADSLLLLAAGTGVGGSYVSGGVPMLGSRAVAGHFGHVAVPQAAGLKCYCGKVGHLEAIGSGAGMLRWYASHGGASEVGSARELFGRAPRDALARRAVERGASAFGAAAAGLANAFDPALVVVAGSLSRGGAVWEDPVREAFRAGLLPLLQELPLVVSEPSGWPSLVGAAHFATSQEDDA
jgi:glucokinase